MRSERRKKEIYIIFRLCCLGAGEQKYVQESNHWDVIVYASNPKRKKEKKSDAAWTLLKLRIESEKKEKHLSTLSKKKKWWRNTGQT